MDGYGSMNTCACKAETAQPVDVPPICTVLSAARGTLRDCHTLAHRTMELLNGPCTEKEAPEDQPMCMTQEVAFIAESLFQLRVKLEKIYGVLGGNG